MGGVWGEFWATPIFRVLEEKEPLHWNEKEQLMKEIESAPHNGN